MKLREEVAREKRIESNGLDKKYRIKVPGGLYHVKATSFKKAIDIGVENLIKELKEMQKDGSIYAIPAIYERED